MSTEYEVYTRNDMGWELVDETRNAYDKYAYNEGFTDTVLIIGSELGDMQVFNAHPQIILSSALTFGDGIFKSEEIPFPESLEGFTNYCGHPNTKVLLEALGAETVQGRWEGPAVGESYIAVPLQFNERPEGFAREVAVQSAKELKAILVTRIA